MSKDYINYDYLSVSVKSDQLSRILQCYRALGWTEITTEDDKQYYDMKYVRLRRPHKIPNKDRLQYLQVRMERAINSLVEITGNAHVKSTAVAVFIVFVAVCFTVLGLWLVMSFSDVLNFIGWICVGLSLAGAVLSVILCFVLRRRERKIATGKIIEKLRLTQALIEEAIELVPADTEKSEGFDDPAPQEVNGQEAVNG